MKKKVYVETSVVSDATALPSKDVASAGRQIVTREWWHSAASRFDLYSSAVVKREATGGDADAARRRLEALVPLPELPTVPQAVLLAEKLMACKAVPREFPDDALHIALATVHKMDFLVSWNFKHITNAQLIPLIKRVCADNGFVCPEICTPYQLQDTEATNG